MAHASRLGQNLSETEKSDVTVPPNHKLLKHCIEVPILQPIVMANNVSAESCPPDRTKQISGGPVPPINHQQQLKETKNSDVTVSPNYDLQGHNLEDAEVSLQDRTMQASKKVKKSVGTAPPNNADKTKIKLQVTEKPEMTSNKNSETGAKNEIKFNFKAKNKKMLQKVNSTLNKSELRKLESKFPRGVLKNVDLNNFKKITTFWSNRVEKHQQRYQTEEPPNCSKNSEGRKNPRDKEKTTPEDNVDITAQKRLEIGTVPNVLIDDQYGGENYGDNFDSYDSGREKLTVVIESDSYANQDKLLRGPVTTFLNDDQCADENSDSYSNCSMLLVGTVPTNLQSSVCDKLLGRTIPPDLLSGDELRCGGLLGGAMPTEVLWRSDEDVQSESDRHESAVFIGTIPPDNLSDRLFDKTVPKDYLQEVKCSASRSENLRSTTVLQNSPKKTRKKKTLTAKGVKRTPLKTCKPKGNISYSYEIATVIEKFNTLSKSDILKSGGKQRRHPTLSVSGKQIEKNFANNCKSGRNCDEPMERRNGPEFLLGANGGTDSGRGLLGGPNMKTTKMDDF